MNGARMMSQPRAKAFPSMIPMEKPSDRQLSAAMHRMYDVWNPHEDRGNPFFTSFRYTSISGIGKEIGVSRRDPSKVIKVKDKYFVWYTRRKTVSAPVGPEKCTDELPAFDWDLAEVYYATSKDGFDWEEQGVAVARTPKGEYGDRAVATPDILAVNGKYYLYFQSYTGKFEVGTGDHCNVSMAWADAPEGPWNLLNKPIIELGEADEWDSKAIHDPYPLVYKGEIWLYYKGEPLNQSDDKISRAQGVAIAQSPEGPFHKSPLNPVLNSGHETGLFPFGEGIAAIISRDGPEKNTVQYAPDGLNFEVKSLVNMPPLAPGPFCPDAFADNGDGQGVSWGLSHTFTENHDECNYILRFDCDLQKEMTTQTFKYAPTRYVEAAFLQPSMRLNEEAKKEIQAHASKKDKETVITNLNPNQSREV
jgi:hypothetical protein